MAAQLDPNSAIKRLRNKVGASDYYILASFVSSFVPILVVASTIFIYQQDTVVEGVSLYVWLLREDGPLEWLTAFLLVLTTLICLITVLWIPEIHKWSRPFLLLFSAFCLVLAFEEISWGQRIFGVESGDFFNKYSDQQEINFHNMMQLYLSRIGVPITTTKEIAAIILFVYGVIFPALNLFRRVEPTFRKLRLVIPPPALMMGFMFGAYLAWYDRPTGFEEELGELLFSLSFALLVPLWLLQQQRLFPYRSPVIGEQISETKVSVVR